MTRRCDESISPHLICLPFVARRVVARCARLVFGTLLENFHAFWEITSEAAPTSVGDPDRSCLPYGDPFDVAKALQCDGFLALEDDQGGSLRPPLLQGLRRLLGRGLLVAAASSRATLSRSAWTERAERSARRGPCG